MKRYIRVGLVSVLGILTALAMPALAALAAPVESVVYKDGNQKVYTLYPNGTGQAQLLSTLGTQPARALPTRDGTKLLWASSGTVVNISAPDGTNPLNIGKSGYTYSTTAFAFSPDGTKVALSAKSSSQTRQAVYIQNADGSGTPTQITADSATNLTVYDWGSSGILYRGASSSLYRVAATAGATGAPISPSGFQVTDARYSPDGTQIAMVGQYVVSGVGQGMNLYVTSNAGSTWTQVSTSPTVRPNSVAWSMDGSTIAVMATTATDSVYRIYKIDPSITTNSPLTEIISSQGTLTTPNYVYWGLMDSPSSPTTITTVDVSGQYSDDVTLSATLMTQASPAAPVPNKTVHFKVNGVDLPTTATTDANGVASIPYSLMTQTAGTYSIEAYFSGDASFAPSDTAPANNKTLTVTQESATLQYKGSALNNGAGVTLSAQVTEVADSWPGDLTKAGTVQFVVTKPDGTSVGTYSGTVNASGVASSSATLAQGPYKVTVHLVANGYYQASDAPAVIQAPTQVTAPDIAAIYSDAVTLSATVTSGGSPVPAGETVNFTVLDGTGATVGTAAGTTDATGKATANYVAGIQAGTYTIKADHVASTYYTASTTTANLTVTPESGTLQYTGGTSWSSSLVLSAKLTEVSDSTPGQAANAGQVIFDVKKPDGTAVGTYTASLAGTGATASASKTVTLPVGPYTVSVSLDPSNGYYQAGTVSAIVNVTTQLNMSPVPTAYSDQVTIPATLTLTDGTPVNGQTIKFTVKDSTGSVVTTGTALTDASGVASFQYTPDTKAGTYTVLASYTATSYYQASSTSANLNETAENATLTYTGPALWTGSTVTLSADITEVTDSWPGQVTKAGSLQFIVTKPDGTAVGTYTGAITGTGASGSATATANLTAGAYKVTVHLDPANGYYQAADAPAVIMADTSMTMSAKFVAYSDQVTMQATLSVSGGATLAGQPVAFTVTDAGGTTLKTGSATTDASGVAAFSFNAGWPAGTYSVTANYAGNTYYTTSSTAANLTVTQENATLTYTGTSNWSGSTVTLSANIAEVADSWPGAITNAGSLTFVVTKVDGSAVGTFTAPVTGTGASGSATTSANLPADAYNVSVQLDPANGYYQAGSVSAVIKVGTTLTVTTTPVQYSDQVVLQANLAVAGGSALGAGNTVAFTVKDGSGATVATGNGTTDASGNAQFTYQAAGKAGTYTVKADYAATTYYNGSTATSNLTVSAEDATLVYTGTSVWASSTVTLSASITEVADTWPGQVNKAGSLQFIVTRKDGSAVGTYPATITGTGATGTASTTATLPAGGYNVTVHLDPANGYYTTSDVSTVIKVNTNLSLANTPATYSDPVTLQATLKFSNGTTVGAGETVSFTILDASNATVATGTGITNSSGVAAFSYTVGVKAGAYTVQTAYAATTYYNGSNTSAALNVIAEGATITYTGDTVWASANTLSATITEASDATPGDITKAGALQFIVTKPDGTAVGTYPAAITGTGANGSATTSVNLPAGVYVVTVHLDPANGYYSATDVQAGIRADTFLTMTDQPVAYSDQVTFQAVLKLQDGTPVAANETVNFTVKDGSGTTVASGSGTTDATGTAPFTFLAPFKAGTYTVHADYPGGTYYNPSNGNATLTVSPESGTLAYTGPTLWTTSSVTLSATLTEVSDSWPGVASKAGSLDFIVTRPDGSTVGTYTATITGTGTTGTASKAVTLSAGAYQVAVHLNPANGYYQAADATAYIRANTTLTVATAFVAYSDQVTIQAALKVAGGSAVGAGETVNFTVTSGATTIASGSGVTDASGNASFAYTAATTPAGSYTVTATYAGAGNFYNGTNGTGTLTETREDATLAYTGDVAYTAGNVNLAASIAEVTDPSPGDITKAGSLQFILTAPDGSTAGTFPASVTGTGASGTASTTAALAANGYKVVVHLDPANGYYAAPDAVGYIKAATALTVANPGTVQYSDKVTLSATLKVAGGSAVGAGLPVTFTVKDGTGATVGTGSGTTNTSGVATWDYVVSVPVGTYSVVADYAGTGSNYYSAGTTATPGTLTVTAEDATLAYTGDTAWTSTTVNLSATVTDVADGAPGNVGNIGNHVQFVVTKPDNTPVGTYTASVTGTGTSLTAATTANLVRGAYKVTVQLDPANGFYTAATPATGYIKTGTTLSVAAPAPVQYSDVVQIQAQLDVAGGGGSVGANETVIFTLKNGTSTVTTFTTTTDVNGTATWNYKADIASGNYTVTADYAGSSFYGASTSTPVTVAVTKEDATLTYVSPSTWSANPTTLTAKVDDAADGSAGDLANTGGQLQFIVTKPDGTTFGTYNGTISAGTSSTVTTSAPLTPGGYLVTLHLPTNGYYQATDVQRYLKANTTLTLTVPATVQYSDKVTLSANLAVTGTTTGVANEVVTFTVKNGTGAVVATNDVTTDASGNAVWNYKADLPAGNYTVTAAYAGTSYYNGASAVTKPLTVSVEDATLVFPGSTSWASSLTLTATINEVADTSDGVISNAGTIDFVITKPDGTAVTTVSSAISGTGTSGTASANVTLAAGAYKVTVHLQSNNYYQAADVVGYIKIGTNLAVTTPIPTVQYSDKVDIQAVLTVAGGGPVGAGETVTFTVKSGATVVATGSGTTDGTGTATWSYTNAVPAGNYTVTADYAGTGNYYNASTSAPANLTVTAEDATLVYTGPTTWTGSAVTLSATVTEVADATSGDVSKIGTHVIFTVTKPDGTPVTGSPFTTDVIGTGNTGTASKAVTLPAGAYKVAVGIDPVNGYYTATDVVGYIRSNTTLTLAAPAPVQYSDSVTFSATLADVGNNPVGANQNVIFTVRNGAAVVASVTKPTNASGVATWTYTTALPAGSYTVTADYAGDTYYNAAPTASQPLTVNVEDATLAMSDTNWTSSMTLTATITDDPDGSAGNVANAGSFLKFDLTRPDGTAAGSFNGSLTGSGTTATATATVAVPANGYKVTVSLPANGYYAAPSKTAYIKAATALTVANPGTVQYSDKVTLSATLKVAGGPAVGSGETVTFTVKDSLGATVDTGTGITDASGVATWDYFAKGPAGTYTVVADYAGTGSNYYTAGTTASPGTLTVTPEDATLAYMGDTAWSSTTVNLAATVTDAADGAPGNVGNIGNNVKFVVTKPDNSPVGTYTAGVTGTGTSLTAATTATLPNGGYKVSVQLDPANGYYQATPATAYVKAGTTLTVTAPASVQYSDVAQIKAQLDVAGGGPVGANETVIFTLKNGATTVTTFTTTTDSNGTATWNYKADIASGAYTVTADYAGTSFYGGSSSSAVPMTVAKEDATLIYVSPATWSANPTTLTAKVDDAADGSAGDLANTGGQLQFTVTKPDGTTFGTYTGSISAGTSSTVTVSAPLTAGGYLVTLHLPTNAYYQAADVQQYLKANTTLTMTPPSAVQYSDKVTLSANLAVSGTSTGVANESVTFTVKNAGGTVVATNNVTTDASGNAVWSYKADIPSGAYTVTASYTGTSYYNGTTAVTRPLTVNLEDATLAYTGPTNWASTLTLTASIDELADASGGVISNAGTIDFVITKPDGSAVTTVSSAITGTGTSGTASADVTLTPGAYKVTVQLQSNNYYQAAPVTANIRIGTNLTVNPIGTVPQYSDTVTITAQLNVTGGGGVTAGRTVTFTATDGTTTVTGTGTTDGTGLATWTYTPVDLKAGNYTVTASFAGDTYYDTSTSTGKTLTVTQEAATLAYTGPQTWSGSAVTLTGTITDDGDGMPGDLAKAGALQFIVTKPDNTAVTGSPFTATMSGTGTTLTGTAAVTLPANGYKVTVHLPANQWYTASDVVKYIAAPTTLTMSDVTAVWSDQATIQAQLGVTGGSNVGAGQSVTFKIMNGATQVDTTTVPTDATGKATWNYVTTNLVPGTAYTIQAIYGGDSMYYQSATTVTSNLTITKENATVAYGAPATWSSSMTVTGTITDEGDGFPGDVQKAGGKLQFDFYAPGASTPTATVQGTIGSGTATATATATGVAIPANGYKVVVSLPANSYYTAPASAPGYIKAPVAFTASDPASVQYSDPASITANLAVVGGPGVIAGESVSIKVTDTTGTTTYASTTTTTDASGNVSWTYKADLPAGTYKVTFDYTGTGSTYYSGPASTTVNLTVTQETATLTPSIPPTWSSSMTLSTTVTDAADGSNGDVTKIGMNVQFVVTKQDGTPVSGSPFLATVTGGPTTGTASVTVNLPAGGYKVITQLGSNSYYTAAASSPSFINVGTTLAISATPATVQYSDQSVITATLSISGGGGPVGANEPVVFTVKDGTNTTVVGPLTVNTDAAGKAIWNFVNSLPAGSYTVYANFAGDSYYQAATQVSTSLTVTAEADTVTYVSPTTYASNLTLTATLADDTDSWPGDLTKANSLQFELQRPDGSTQGIYPATMSGTSPRTGTASVTGLPAGGYKVIVTVAGNSYYAAGSDVKYIKAPTQLTTSAVTTEWSDPAAISAVLKIQGTATVVSGEPVTFTISDGTTTVAGPQVVNTDATGTATWNYPTSSLVPGTAYTITVTYGGGNYFLAASDVTANLTINKENATLAFTGPSTWSNGMTVTGTITDQADGNAGNVQMAGGKLQFDFYAPGASTPTTSVQGTIGAGATSATATASNVTTVPANGYKVIVTLPANGYYAAPASAPGYIKAPVAFTASNIGPVQYSDPAALTANLAVVGGPSVIAGESVDIKVTDTTGTTTYASITKTTDASGNVSWNWPVTVPAGTYNVTYTFTGTGSTYYSGPASKTVTLTVTAEDASLNPTIPANWMSSMTFSTTVTDAPDTNPGNVTNIGNNVQFVVTTPDGTLVNSYTANVTGGPTSGTASTSVSLPNGAYKVVTQLSGSQGYYTAPASSPSYIKAAPTLSLSVTPSTVQYSDKVAITATMSTGGNPVGTGEQITLKVWSGAANTGTLLTTQVLTTNAFGQVAWDWVNSNPAGTYTVSVDFAGDTYYSAATQATAGVTVTQESDSVAYTGLGTWAANLTLTGTLTDDPDTTPGSLANAPAIQFVLTKPDGTAQGTYTATMSGTGSTINGSYSFTSLPANGYKVVVQEPGNGYYAASSAPAQYIKAPTTISLTATPSTVQYSDQSVIKATVQVTGGPTVISGETVDITVLDSTNAVVASFTNTTDSSGAVTWNYANNLKPGTYTVKAAYSATSSLYYLPATTAQLTLTVTKEDANLVFTGPSTWSSNMNLTATITDAGDGFSGNLQNAGGAVQFVLYKPDGSTWGTINGTIGAGTTSATGTAANVTTVPQNGYKVQVLLPTNNYYTAAPSPFAYIVGPTTVTVTNLTGVKYGQSVTLSATLTSGTNAISGAQLSFSVNGTAVGTATTNATGTATIPYTANLPPGGGPYTISVTYTGPATPYYQQGTSGTGTLSMVKDTPTLTMLASSVQYGDYPVAIAVMKDSSGNPVRVGTMVNLTVTVGGVPYSTTAPTDSTGQASWICTACGQYDGTSTVTASASFTTDQYYNGLPATSPVSFTTGPESGQLYNFTFQRNGNSNNYKIDFSFVEVDDSSTGTNQVGGALGNWTGSTIPVTVEYWNASLNGGAGGWVACINATLLPSGSPASAALGATNCQSTVSLAGNQVRVSVGSNPYYTAPAHVGTIPNGQNNGTFSVTSPTVTSGSTTTLSAGVTTVATASMTASGVQAQSVLLASAYPSKAPMPSLYKNLLPGTGGSKPAVPPGLVGQPVEFLVNGVSVGVAPIQYDGTASLQYKADLPAGKYVIQALFRGHAANAPGSGEGTLTVNARPAILTYTGDLSSSATGLTLGATLSDKTGEAVDFSKAGNVHFSLKDAGGTVVNTYDVPVGVSGAAIKVVAPPTPGAYTVTVSLANEDYFTAAPVTVNILVPVMEAPPAGDGGSTTPPTGGGDTTTTPPASGGDTTTPPPTGGGDTTSPPTSGGDTTAPPASGGGSTTTPPASGGSPVLMPPTFKPPSSGGGSIKPLEDGSGTTTTEPTSIAQVRVA